MFYHKNPQFTVNSGLQNSKKWIFQFFLFSFFFQTERNMSIWGGQEICRALQEGQEKVWLFICLTELTSNCLRIEKELEEATEEEEDENTMEDGSDIDVETEGDEEDSEELSQTENEDEEESENTEAESAEEKSADEEEKIKKAEASMMGSVHT